MNVVYDIDGLSIYFEYVKAGVVKTLKGSCCSTPIVRQIIRSFNQPSSTVCFTFTTPKSAFYASLLLPITRCLHLL